MNDERRRFKRANFSCKIYILTTPLHIIKCKTENIGAGGIRVLLDENLTLHSNVGLKLYLLEEPIECKGKIVWLVERKNDHKITKFDIGIEFHQISEKDRETISLFVKSLI